LRNRKALDLIVENARVTDEEWREDSGETEQSAARGNASGPEPAEQTRETDEAQARSSSAEG
jgi:hypothetical protein